MRSDTSVPNRLINEKSPYLLQHAHNPVDWFAWGDEAFKLARESGKPIFLSVGYSACYWCHVMEREVFEKEEIAALMNEFFVNVKVDREERPDVDRVYMTVLQAITGSGGWPMSIFLTPELKPFYAATYIPPKAKYGRAGFEDVITEINKLWNSKRDEIYQSSDNIVDTIEKNLSRQDGSQLNKSLFNNALTQFEQMYDNENGGFGSGNKFPRPAGFEFLLNHYSENKEFPALDMCLFSLKKMFGGGMYDHLGNGFHRYSVDVFWRVPHFEKMLYDQAQLISLYVNAYRLTGKEFFLNVAERTAEYVFSNLSHPAGAFYSAEDAESAPDPAQPGRKEEGAYYLWEKNELDDLLGPDISKIFSYCYGVEQHGNTIHDPHEVFGTGNVLYFAHDEFEASAKFGITPDEINASLERAKEILLEKRNKRPAPALDDKILTNWNSLMISALCALYNATGSVDYLNRAVQSAEFILGNLVDKEKPGMLYHRYKEGEARFSGTLEDYAFFIKALLDLYESSFQTEYLGKALLFNRTVMNSFYDSAVSGFFDALPDEADIILRTKETYDGAEPSGNAVQIMNLLRIAAMTDNPELKETAGNCLRLFSGELKSMPFSSPAMLCALNFYLGQPAEIIVSGDPEDQRTQSLAMHVRKMYLPNSVILNAFGNANEFFPFLEKIVGKKDEPAVYVCRNYACNLPTNDTDKLSELLRS